MITRRKLLRILGLAPLAGTLGSASSRVLSANSWKQAFDSALTGNSRLLGWHGVKEHQLAAPNLPVTGALPPDLIGTFYRNGPARHERGGHRYRHWFDGDGMVQAFRFDGRSISHLGRIVETAKHVAEEQAGRHIFPAFGTAAPRSPPLRGADDLNPANISVCHHGGELLALWEGGSAHQIDERTLNTIGRKTWHENLKGAAFSAHPKIEPNGTFWNFGNIVGQGLLVLYHIASDGRLNNVGTVPIDNPGMVHDFAVTARHLIFVIPPLVYDQSLFGSEISFLDAHVWRPELGTRVLVVDKTDFTRRRWYQLPTGFNFHFGNAWEDSAQNIRFDYCVAADATVMTDTFRYVMRGEFQHATGPTRFAQVVLHAGGGATQEITDVAAEFPRVSPAIVGRRYRQVYAVIGGIGISGAGLGGIARIDTETGIADSFEYGDRFIVEEHVFVPRPGTMTETDGWLVGTVLDLDDQVTRISLFDAARLSDGPIAWVSLPYPLPLGFHGTFVAK